MRAALSPREIAEEIADVAAMVESDERDAIVSAVAAAVRAERRGAIKLTKSEAKAVLAAISQKRRNQTGGTRGEWAALLRAEAKISVGAT